MKKLGIGCAVLGALAFVALIFVVLRLAHAYVHTSSNDVRQRGGIYIAGAIVLALMWLIFMGRILLGLG